MEGMIDKVSCNYVHTNSTATTHIHVKYKNAHSDHTTTGRVKLCIHCINLPCTHTEHEYFSKLSLVIKTSCYYAHNPRARRKGLA